MQSGGVIRNMPILENILLSLTKKGTDIVGNLGKDFLNKQIEKT